jgi:HNH endonuclease
LGFREKDRDESTWWPCVTAALFLAIIGSGSAWAELVQQWRTPTGAVYFGDHPPTGSSLVGETETLGTSGGGEVTTSATRIHKDAERAARQPAEHSKARADNVERDGRGKIKRSAAARHAFLRAQGLARTPRGCQVDHIVPLAKGGPDVPANMQLLCGEALREKEANELR